ncbi:hypothetical protein H4Q26_004271 [Puccinia striiformis f. sp. tritici PST-130]|uniref:Uncharacterized protein n=1 Tax=Puccinia striiformis f. sp. tritici PST-78 TaxID=1165861 RepID=A0A0L0V8X9_9BASI|nr:hypothetical protein Pst134EB_023627 [Puccinia striiformis f. sp. tritici]KAI9605901.1 hypothetical protein H4Q26_004271 [Puccinia striiformis f. sp. tritici PST-130]KNE95745.1 hypothetical protein PSTG_10961 [Puccinia striiformis f. sp. tritici PST-78]
MVDSVELRIQTRPTPHLNTQTLKTPLSVGLSHRLLTPLEYSRDGNSDLPRSNMVDPVELRIQTRPTPHLNTQTLKTPLSVGLSHRLLTPLGYSRDGNSDPPRSNMVDPVELRIQTQPTPHLNTQTPKTRNQPRGCLLD